MPRQSGYYWVKYKGNWVTAEWYSNAFYLPGYDGSFGKNDVEEIDERRIERKALTINPDYRGEIPSTLEECIKLGYLIEE